MRLMTNPCRIGVRDHAVASAFAIVTYAEGWTARLCLLNFGTGERSARPAHSPGVFTRVEQYEQASAKPRGLLLEIPSFSKPPTPKRGNKIRLAVAGSDPARR